MLLLGTAMIWSAFKTREERADEVQAEAGTIATTAATLLNEYFSSLDAMASTLVRHPAVVALDGPASERLFKSLLTEQPLLGNVLLRGSDTRLLASAIPSPTPEAAAPPIVSQVLTSGRPQASQLVIGPITRRRTVFLAYPVRNDAQKVVGVLGFSVLLPQLEGLFLKLPLPEGSVVVLADQRSFIMARSVESEKYIGQSIDVAPGAPLTSFQLDADGVERFHGNAMIERGPWLLSVAIPRTEVLKRLSPLWRRNLVIISAALISILGLTFHDLRGSAVVRLALADATVPQIATFTGHSLHGVEAILDAHYLGRDVKLAEIAVMKLETRTKL